MQLAPLRQRDALYLSPEITLILATVTRQARVKQKWKWGGVGVARWSHLNSENDVVESEMGRV